MINVNPLLIRAKAALIHHVQAALIHLLGIPGCFRPWRQELSLSWLKPLLLAE